MIILKQKLHGSHWNVLNYLNNSLWLIVFDYILTFASQSNFNRLRALGLNATNAKPQIRATRTANNLKPAMQKSCP